MIDLKQSMVHVAIGTVAGMDLAKGVSPVLVNNDNLLFGPSSIGLKRNRVVRAQYWGGEPSFELNEELARGAGPPLCVWLPPTPHGFLSLFQICAVALKRERTVFVVDLAPVIPAPLPQGPDPAPAPYVDVAKILPHPPPAAKWSKREMESAATLWRLWCRRSPVGFSKLCASEDEQNPARANLGRYHAGNFPRYVDRRLLLSRFDELLLRQLSQEWISPVKVYVNAVNAEAGLYAWLSHMGDLCVVERLLEWSRHTRGRIVERQKEPLVRPSAMKRWSFRWASGAESILDALPSLRAAPPVSIGGAVAYDPEHPWVCRFDATGTPYIRRLGARSGGDSDA